MKDKELFLPTDYDDKVIVKESNYMKFKEDGEYRFRFLSSPIVGIECWKDGKPVRFKTKADVPNENWDVNKFTGKPKQPVTFWAAIVWNHNIKRMQILNLTQPSILEAIKGAVDDPDIGSPKKYDIKIVRSKKGDKIEYSVRTVPPTELDPMIVAEYGMCNWDLGKLFTGEDPFTA